MVLWLWILACGTPELPESVSVGPDHHAPQVVGIAAQAGEQHPPIPANDPVWKNLGAGFKSVPMVYGEERWDDVTMRVIGHLAQASRDLARLDWQEAKHAEAITRYRNLSIRLNSIQLDEPGASRTLRDLHVQAANHHAAVLSKRAGLAVPEPKHLGANSQRRWKKALGERVDPEGHAPWTGLEIDRFKDFRDRHTLRLRMTEYWLDSVDPAVFSDPWGYWRPAVADHTAQNLSELASGDLTQAYPSQLSAEDLGRLPTGDTYLDTAGGAGPQSIGTLAVLGLDDAEHKARLERWAAHLNGLVDTNPSDFVQAITAYQSELEAYPHGSRFYNIKQLINAGTRHLARAGHYSQALELFQFHRPLHAQDWLCPNREGIQLGIEGRLLALMGEEQKARQTLEAARAESFQWLSKIRQAKRSPVAHPQGPALRK
jgi:hypothetical protein